MRVYHYLQRFFALFGVHAEKLSKHPRTTVLGLAGRPIDLIIDVGANTGQFAREMRGRFPKAHIVCFEPLPEAFAELEAWARADGNATACNLGLGESDATLPFYRHVGHPTSSSMLASHPSGVATFPQMGQAEKIEVSVRRLDDVLAEIGRPAGAGTLLKLDVQGFEEQVMRGAPETLRQVGALIAEVIIDPLYHGQSEFRALADLAYAAGLRYGGNYAQNLAADGHVVFIDAVFIR